MARQCQSCGGVYEPIQADGSEYYHVCPPLSALELQAAVDAGAVQLPKGEDVDAAVARRSYERADHRDENVRRRRDDDTIEIKAEGAGTVDAPIAVDEPGPIVKVPPTRDAVQP